MRAAAAAGAELLAAEILELPYLAVFAHDERLADIVRRLADVDPVVARRALDVRRDMVAADELHLAGPEKLVRLFRRDVEIIIDLETLLLPSAAFRADVQQGQVARRWVGKSHCLHAVRPFFPSWGLFALVATVLRRTSR